MLSGSGSTDFDDDDESEVLTAKDILDAEMLAERFEADDDRTLADRAAADRRWTYGHVIVDEAQELTPMAWRAIARRCPLRSMTVVGDVAQTGAIGGGTSWSAALGETFGDRWRLAELTLNYRTPAEVMDLAQDVLREVDPSARAPRSVRSTGVKPWHADVPAAEQAAVRLQDRRRGDAVRPGRRHHVPQPARTRPGGGRRPRRRHGPERARGEGPRVRLRPGRRPRRHRDRVPARSARPVRRSDPMHPTTRSRRHASRRTPGLRRLGLVGRRSCSADEPWTPMTPGASMTAGGNHEWRTVFAHALSQARSPRS